MKKKILVSNYIILFCLLLQLKISAQTVGISKDDFETHYRPQKTATWCWASCAEMVLSYKGIDLPQEAIVTRVRGSVRDGGANTYEMIYSTNGIFTDVSSDEVVISGQFVHSAPSTTVLYNQLKNNRPVILTYSTGPWSGHAIVLTAAHYTRAGNTININRFYAFDPFCYVQKFDLMGRPYLEEDRSLSYKEYGLQISHLGLQLMINNQPVGIVTGVIMMDAAAL